MEFERDVLVSPTTEVPVVEGEVVTAIRTLAGRGVGKKAIAREVGVAVNTVRRYLRQPIEPGQQVRPGRAAADRRSARRGADALRGAGGRQCGRRAAAARRARAARSACGPSSGRSPTFDARSAWPQLATVRVETAPGDQLQIDFGQKRVQIAGARRARLPPGRGAQLLAPPLRQSVSQ